MDNVPVTSAIPTVIPTAPSTSMASAPAAAVVTDVITPAVQQFMSLARSANHASESVTTNTSIATPEYSSLTGRNSGQQPPNMRLDPPPRNNGADPVANTAETLPRDLSRQLNDFQRSLQEFVRNLGQQMGQAAAAHNNVAAPPHTPVQPLTGGDYLGGDHHGSYTHDFRPERVPRHTQAFGPNSSPFNARPDPYHQPVSRVDLSKWGLKFDGTSKSISAEDFIFRLDVLRQDYGCSFNDILRSFHLLLEGQALDWYWNVRKLTPIRTWQDLEVAFLTQYRRYESEFQLQKKIMDRRQSPQESFEDYYNAIIKLRNQQRSPYSERDLVEIMRSNLKPALAHLLFSVRIDSLHEFCQQAKRAESLIYSQRHQGQYRTFPPQRVNALDYDDPNLKEVDPEVEELNTNDQYTCWNCRQKGHGFMDCPSPNRRLFCFRCGRDGVVTPKCPTIQGNGHRDKSHLGRTRSTQT